MTSLARAKLLELGSQHSLMLHHLLATVHRPAVQRRLHKWPDGLGQGGDKAKSLTVRKKHSQNHLETKRIRKHLCTYLQQNTFCALLRKTLCNQDDKHQHSTPEMIQLRSQPHHFEAGSSTYRIRWIRWIRITDESASW